VDLKTVEQTMADFCLRNPLNVVQELDALRIYDQPLVGVTKVDDPLFESLKKTDIVGPNHLSPREWLATGKVVISYFLPFTKRIRESNRTMGLPVREWLYGRIEGEQFNVALRKFMIRWFLDAGHDAMAPALDGRFKVINRISNWSERHVAYIAGLGTFSLSCSFITKQGSAGRLGSLVVNVELETTPRYYKSKDENCSQCGSCILRCPPLAITEVGKDHAVCSDYLDRVLARYRPRYGCGKCQTGVPCEGQIPKTKDKARH